MTSPKATSSMCGDPNQVRYQKALKQITKLINYNNELKEQLATAQQQLNTVNERFSYKDARINQLVQQKEDLEGQLNQLTKKYLDLQEQNVRLNFEINELKAKVIQNIPNIAVTQSRNLESDSKRIRPFSKDSTNLQQRKIQNLEKALAEKNEAVRQLYSSNNQLRNKLEQIYGSTNAPPRKDSLKNQVENIPVFVKNYENTLENSELRNKLKAAEEWNDNLTTECAALKAKLLQLQGTNNALMKVKSEKYLLASPAEHSPRSMYLSPPNYSRPGNDTEMVKRTKKLEKQNKKLQKKYYEHKLEFDELKESLRKVQSENRTLSAKTQGYELIIEKQEKQMEEMMKSYEKELEYYRDSFKEKLEEQRKSFSPSKNAKTMKIVETLQSENKALKKKFQLCSVELSKCFKTLEAYKGKLSECEHDYNQLARDKSRLLDEIAKLKGSHRQRSSHSKNSVIRQQGMIQNFGNSSVIEDL